MEGIQEDIPFAGSDHGGHPQLGKNAFVLRMREWENAQIRQATYNPLSDSRETGWIASA